MEIFGVIEYHGDNSTFVWKHPLENFNSGSTLIVRESQEAIFINNGEALPPFGPGKYKLDTEGIPIVSSVMKLLTKGKSAFSAEVYFVNKSVQMGMKWGTDSRVRFIDPVTGIPLDIGASGEMNLRVEDSCRFLHSIVGTSGGIDNKAALTDDGNSSDARKTLQRYFRAPLMTEIKTYLAGVIKEQQINIFEIDARMDDLSKALHQRIAPKFAEYGISLDNFYITNISLPEDDKNFKDIKTLISQAYIGVRAEEVKAEIAQAAGNRKKVEAQTEAELNLINAQSRAEVKMTETGAEVAAMRAKGLAEAEIMRAKGYTEKDLIDADVQKAYAAGMGAMGAVGNNAMAEMFGVMANMKMAGNMMDRMDQAMSKAAPAEAPVEADTWECECGEKGNTKKFCGSCGKPRPVAVAADTWNCACGAKGIKSKFCPECGSPRPAAPEKWDCACGAKGIESKFCPECGSPRPVVPEKWTCKCGKTGIESKFCPECGSRREI